MIGKNNARKPTQTDERYAKNPKNISSGNSIHDIIFKILNLKFWIDFQSDGLKFINQILKLIFYTIISS